MASVALTLESASTTWAVEAPRGDLYLLCVGVDSSFNGPNGYDTRGHDRYSRDALNVREALVAAEPFFDAIHSKVLTGQRATPDAVRAGLRWLSLEMRERDFAVVFFSAHGDVEPGRGFHLSLAAASAASTERGSSQHTFAGSELTRALSLLNGRRLVLVDACRAGGLLHGVERDKANAERSAFLVACAEDEFSVGQAERADRPHGFFTLALCEAFAGLADRNVDGRIMLSEVLDYVGPRARAFYSGQNAVVHRASQFGDVALGEVSHPGTLQQLWTPRNWRNPFGVPDVRDVEAPDVQTFAATVKWDGVGESANAAPWPSGTLAEAPDSIDGRWFSRWDMHTRAGQWQPGTAQLKTIGDRVYIYYQDRSPYILELKRTGSDLLVGRYLNLANPADSEPWVGRIVSPDRIDGRWPKGRWDLRRRPPERATQ